MKRLNNQSIWRTVVSLMVVFSFAMAGVFASGSVHPVAAQNPATDDVEAHMGAYEKGQNRQDTCGPGATTITLRPGDDDGKDARLSSLYPEQNYAHIVDLNATAWTANGIEAIVRNVFQFDLSSVSPGSQISSAKLSLFNTPSTGSGLVNGEHSSLSGSNEAVIQRVTYSWDEDQVTWKNQPTTTTQNEAAVPQSTDPHQEM